MDSEINITYKISKSRMYFKTKIKKQGNKDEKTDNSRKLEDE